MVWGRRHRRRPHTVPFIGHHMLRFITRRMITAVGVLFAATYLFFILAANSGDPLEDLRESSQPNRDELIATRTAELHLDVNPFIRYFYWLAARPSRRPRQRLQDRPRRDVDARRRDGADDQARRLRVGRGHRARRPDRHHLRASPVLGLRLRHHAADVPDVLAALVLGGRAAQAVGRDRLQRLPRGSRDSARWR